MSDCENNLYKTEEARERPFNEEELEQVFQFFSCIKRVAIRLLSEGYTIKEGKFIPPEKK